MISYETMTGTVTISKDYLSKLIGHAVTSCFGVAGMKHNSKRQFIKGLITKKDTIDKGITVTGNADSINVELHIVVTYGMNINAIAKSIVHKVKYVVEDTTGIVVKKVTVKVDGIKE
ncbi:MAG: Asp23/Gls24 family envelope stress response protein [Acutalibacteraceae bacterium]|nr:Asp23/Gls24 family envelope stress response protein [Acutalibacteraceae bacterium]